MLARIAVLFLFVVAFDARAVLAADGKVIYVQTCAACHANGVANAPRLADKAAWEPRLKSGKDALLVSVLKGKGAMPPKGGNASLSEDDVRAALDYIVAQTR